jgi:hypothetical protein
MNTRVDCAASARAVLVQGWAEVARADRNGGVPEVARLAHEPGMDPQQIEAAYTARQRDPRQAGAA